MEEKYTLSHGCWRGTITSRDVAEPEQFDTREAAIAKLNDHRRFYVSIGYQVWFANLKLPDGTVEHLA